MEEKSDFSKLFGKREEGEEPAPLSQSEVLSRAHREGTNLDVVLEDYKKRGVKLDQEAAQTLTDLGKRDYVDSHPEMFEELDFEVKEDEDYGGSSLDEPSADERAERRERESIARDEKQGGTIPSDNPDKY